MAAFDKNNQDFPDTNLSEKGEYDMCTYVNNMDTFILSIMKFFSNIL